MTHLALAALPTGPPFSDIRAAKLAKASLVVREAEA
jgi:hypothetical protein